MTGQSGSNASRWVSGLFLFQAPWLALAIFVWQLPFFFSSMLYDSAWWGMLFILLSFCAMLPTIIALGIKMTNVPNVSNRYKEQMWWGIGLLPFGLEFAYLLMVALPFTWTFLPWGDFAYNWWKIFPYFGLSWMSIFSLFPLYMIFGPDSEPVHELGSRYLQKGMKGSDVREVQQLLNEHGISCGVDGKFGPQTEDAVKQFQTGVGFGMKDDGVVGKKTLAALQIVPELGSRPLLKGMKGADVREMQELLNRHGASIGVDGSFGSQTEGALKQFQTDSGLESDGIVEEETLAALQKEPEKPDISVSVNPPVPIHHQPITVSFSDNTGDNHSWIGLYKPDASNGEHGEKWLYVGGAKTPSEVVDEGAVTFSEGLAPGDYEVRLFGDNGLERLLISHAFTVTDQELGSKPEVRMKDAIIHGNHLHGTTIDHPKFGTDEIKTSSIINQDKEGEIHRIETKNTIYLINENDWTDDLPEEEEAPVEETPVEVKAKQQAAEPIQTPTRDLKAVAKDLQAAAFSSDRKKIIEGLGDTPQSLDITIERVERTTGIGLPDELRRGMTIYGKNTDGSELEIRMPNSMNDEFKKLGKGDSLSCDAVAAGWNSMRKLIQMNWKG